MSESEPHASLVLHLGAWRAYGRRSADEDPQRIRLAPLTLLLGRNSSGKSSVIEAVATFCQSLAENEGDPSGVLRPVLGGGLLRLPSLEDLAHHSGPDAADDGRLDITLEWTDPDDQVKDRIRYRMGPDGELHTTVTLQEIFRRDWFAATDLMPPTDRWWLGGARGFRLPGREGYGERALVRSLTAWLAHAAWVGLAPAFDPEPRDRRLPWDEDVPEDVVAEDGVAHLLYTLPLETDAPAVRSELPAARPDGGAAVLGPAVDADTEIRAALHRTQTEEGEGPVVRGTLVVRLPWRTAVRRFVAGRILEDVAALTRWWTANVEADAFQARPLALGACYRPKGTPRRALDLHWPRSWLWHLRAVKASEAAPSTEETEWVTALGALTRTWWRARYERPDDDPRVVLDDVDPPYAESAPCDAAWRDRYGNWSVLRGGSVGVPIEMHPHLRARARRGAWLPWLSMHRTTVAARRPDALHLEDVQAGEVPRENALRRVLTALRPGERVALRIDEEDGVWERAEGEDVVLRSVGEVPAAWTEAHELLLRDEEETERVPVCLAAYAGPGVVDAHTLFSAEPAAWTTWQDMVEEPWRIFPAVMRIPLDPEAHDRSPRGLLADVPDGVLEHLLAHGALAGQVEEATPVPLTSLKEQLPEETTALCVHLRLFFGAVWEGDASRWKAALVAETQRATRTANDHLAHHAEALGLPGGQAAEASPYRMLDVDTPPGTLLYRDPGFLDVLDDLERWERAAPGEEPEWISWSVPLPGVPMSGVPWRWSYAMCEGVGVGPGIFDLEAYALGPLRARGGDPVGFPDARHVGLDGAATPWVLRKHLHQLGRYPLPESGEEVDGRSLQPALEAWLAHLGVGRRIRVITQPRVGPVIQIAEHGADDWIPMEQCGTGVSQVVPILVQGLVTAARCQPRDENVLFLVQQPELHLHPDAQARIADFLVALAKDGVTVVVESHSEHVLSRVRYHVVGDVGDELAGQVSLVFGERDAYGSPRLRTSGIEPYGMIQDWPAGFFDQGLEDAAAIVRAAERKRRRNQEGEDA